MTAVALRPPLNDARRVQGSVAFSFTAHAVALGLFLGLKAMQPEKQLIELHEVEFIDLKPQAAIERPAVHAPPQRLRDFLKMALPSLKASAPQEAPRELPRGLQERAFTQTPLLVGKSDPLDRAAALRIDGAKPSRVSGASLGEISQRSNAPQAASMADVSTEKTIDLGAVGRRAVAPAGPAIRIEGSGLARSGLRDLPTGPALSAGPRGGSPTGVVEAGIDLREGGPARRGSMPSGGGTTFGYSSGGGLSLAERPAGRPAKAAMPPAAEAAPAKAAEIAQASSKKAVEISGPLAGRKVLSMVMPRYPEWAREKNVEADVLIRFFVDAEGKVLDRMFIERSSGYKELDDLCLEAVKKILFKKILFVPLTGGAKEDQWGVITFRFRLS
jgi:TonB family protein